MNICLLLESNFQNPVFFSLSVSQAPGRLGRRVQNEERGREKYSCAPVVMHKLFLNYSLGYISPNKVYVPQMQTGSTVHCFNPSTYHRVQHITDT